MQKLVEYQEVYWSLLEFSNLQKYREVVDILNLIVYDLEVFMILKNGLALIYKIDVDKNSKYKKLKFAKNQIFLQRINMKKGYCYNSKILE